MVIVVDLDGVLVVIVVVVVETGTLGKRYRVKVPLYPSCLLRKSTACGDDDTRLS